VSNVIQFSGHALVPEADHWQPATGTAQMRHGHLASAVLITQVINVTAQVLPEPKMQVLERVSVTDRNFREDKIQELEEINPGQIRWVAPPLHTAWEFPYSTSTPRIILLPLFLIFRCYKSPSYNTHRSTRKRKRKEKKKIKSDYEAQSLMCRLIVLAPRRS